LAGVALEAPVESPVNAIFNDPRARLVPAHLLVRDRFNADEAGNALLIPSLWLIAEPASSKAAGHAQHPAGYDRITATKMIVWLNPSPAPTQASADAYTRWLDDLPHRAGTP
jgi:hypothetical protein